MDRLTNASISDPFGIKLLMLELSLYANTISETASSFYSDTAPSIIWTNCPNPSFLSPLDWNYSHICTLLNEIMYFISSLLNYIILLYVILWYYIILYHIISYNIILSYYSHKHIVSTTPMSFKPFVLSCTFWCPLPPKATDVARASSTSRQNPNPLILEKTLSGLVFSMSFPLMSDRYL